MKVRLGIGTWTECRADQNLKFVRAAFYLGYSVIEIRSIVRDPSMQKDMRAIIQTAINLGMTDPDTVVLDQNVRP